MGTLAIIGLGMIGGSMGLALKRAEPVNTEIIGYDRDEEVGVRAHRAGAIQWLAPTLEEAVEKATLVIVATPIINMRKVFQEMAPHLQTGTVVTDVASTKADVLRWAQELLPPGIHFVGGHPMAGKEQSGPQAAEETIFVDRPYCIVPALNASPGAVNAVVGLVQAVEAVPFYLDADEHDSYAAAISHVPLVASLALFSLAHGTSAWPELASMAGPAFRDLTRLASGEPEMSHDIFVTNKTNVVHWIDRYIEELQTISNLISSGDSEVLFRNLVNTQIERDNFIYSPPKREEGLGPDVELPSAGESFMNMMAGSLWRERAKDIIESLDQRAKERDLERRMRRQE
jgi:prephenate dehydrogenase